MHTLPITRKQFDGNLIYRRRVELGLTLEQVATFVGVGIKAVQTWEKGIRIPREEHMPKLAKALQVRDALFFFNPNLTKSA